METRSQFPRCCLSCRHEWATACKQMLGLFTASRGGSGVPAVDLTIWIVLDFSNSKLQSQAALLLSQPGSNPLRERPSCLSHMQGYPRAAVRVMDRTVGRRVLETAPSEYAGALATLRVRAKLSNDHPPSDAATR